MFSKKHIYSLCLVSASVLWTSASAATTQPDDLLYPAISVSTEEISPNNVEGPITINGGAWASSGYGPTLRNTGLYYTLDLPVVGSVPFGSKITSVNYSWSYSYVPPGMLVYLCLNSTNNCVNVSTSKSGRLTNFNDQAANKKFIFAFGVRGNGSVLSPAAYGQRSQVIVNYN
ncbi:flagellar protein FlhE [Pseudoalteromonas sp. PPB1]|uniref:flagellar protein FlhE n=1 Tax=Pseudoalteromonas sp. PPB1 TaxID=2756136 RepID=UPI001891CAAC|nr:flagellar protein FlhE [Pseudoalteromonas sp. PPB1]